MSDKPIILDRRAIASPGHNGSPQSFSTPSIAPQQQIMEPLKLPSTNSTSSMLLVKSDKLEDYATKAIAQAAKSAELKYEQLEKCQKISFEPEKDVQAVDKLLTITTSILDGLQKNLEQQGDTAKLGPLEVEGYLEAIQKCSSIITKNLAERRKLANQAYNSDATANSPIFNLWAKQVNNFGHSKPKIKRNGVVALDDEDEDIEEEY